MLHAFCKHSRQLCKRTEAHKVYRHAITSNIAHKNQMRKCKKAREKTKYEKIRRGDVSKENILYVYCFLHSTEAKQYISFGISYGYEQKRNRTQIKVNKHDHNEPNKKNKP